MRRVAVVALCAFVAGCGSDPTGNTSKVKASRGGFLAQDVILSGISARVTDLNEQGFKLIIPKSFQDNGEEKLFLNEVRVKFPLKIHSAFEWDRNVGLPGETYFAGDQEVTFHWNLTGRSREIVTVTVKGKSEPTNVINDPRLIVEAINSSGLANTKRIRISFREGGDQPSEDAPNIAIDGPEIDSRFVQTALSHLYAASGRKKLPVKQYGFAPFGLNNSLYFGHTFWDMDVWVLPSMLFLQPEAVRQMNQYRLDRAEQAEMNAAEYFKRPDSGMKFPWESSVSGKETVPGPSQKEHHISGSVLWGLNLSEKAGIAAQGEVAKVAAGVGKFFSLRSVPGPNGREIKDVMSPDENHIGDNDLYTNLLAQWAMNGRKWERPSKFKLPKDAKSFLTYDGDPERGYKQAAAVLSIFPLQYPEAERQARVMMERFEGKVSKNGPAMTDAIHATIWARLGEKEKAYDAWKRAWEPFVRGPQMMFSEKRTSDRTYFYTGAAGCLNTVLYGFAGFRFDEKPAEGALWKKQLKSGWWISCKPQLPPKWKSLRISPMTIDGVKYNVEVRNDAVEVELSK